MKITIGFKVKCRLCGIELQAPTGQELKEKLHNHIDKDCEVAKTLRDWDKAGVFQDMVALLGRQAVSKELQKLIKRYSLETVKEELEFLEQEQE